MMKRRRPGQCLHARLCDGYEEGRHDETCPRLVLKLSDGDVEAFCAEHATYANDNVRATYKGRWASCSVTYDCSLSRAKRFVAESLIMSEREAMV